MKQKRVAILGTSFRLPGSKPSEFWPSLLAGKSLVTEVAADRWAKETFLHPLRSNRGTSYTFAAGSIGDIYGFDAAFFGISPREAAQMDPQQRLLLEMSWEAFENAGIVPSKVRGAACGVYIGISSTDYSFRFAEDLAAVDSNNATGTTASIAANRISYIFDLRGPSMAVDTACSSSLVAFHLACRSILSGECSMAITGGVSLHLHPYGFVAFSKASMLSKRGVCNVFDASGDGYVRSEGGGIFLLKDYDQAVTDGDAIIAVVANTTVNSDGKKSGLTVPSIHAQASLLKQAYAEAGISPLDIDYIEAHGTGTAVGDPIETHALGDALGQRRPADNPLLIGSVKSNLGHLEAASGVAGLVKALHCIQHRVVPATIGVTTPNPNIKFDDWNIKVVTEQHQLKDAGKLIIGINSFGFGGANAHVILESYEQPKSKPPKHHKATPLPLIISAKSSAALKAVAGDFSAYLALQPQSALYDIAYNAAFRREMHEHRAIVYGTTTQAISKSLLAFANDASEPHGVESGVALESPCGPTFIYSGNGSQWEGMGKRLLEEDPVFKEAVRAVDALFQRHAAYSLEDELAGRNGVSRFEYTEIAQPALFALQVGITQMLRQRGITPVAVAGHSVGEVAAAWASGALSLESAVAVIYHRSHLQGSTKGKGAMTAVGLGATEAGNLISELGLASGVAIAGINSSRGVALAGNPHQLTQIESVLNERNIFNKRLDLDYAFHSSAMDGIEAGIQQTLAALQPGPTLTPFYSTVSGTVLDGKALSAEYWWHNIRKPVLFEHAIKGMLAHGINVFIEVGPHAVMRGYVNDSLKDNSTKGLFIPTLTRGDDAPRRVWSACDQTAICGASSGWQNAFSWAGGFVRLPNYPWQREHLNHPVTTESNGLLERITLHPLLGYPLNHLELTWENQLDTARHPSLADHVVGEATVFPSTGFSELALAAALQWQPGTLAEFEELEIVSPLILGAEHAKIIRTSIDKQDGRITVSAREHAGAEPWTLHAVGRILREPRDILMRELAPALPTRLPDFTGASHLALTKAASLDYGPAFQCIDFGWIEGDTALAVFKTPECISDEINEMHLHPALLDCTFQLIIQLLKEDLNIPGGVAFVPTKMGRVAFRTTTSKPHLARVTVLRRSPHSLTAEFTVFDKEGAVIAVVKEGRFRSIRLSKNAADHLRFLAYHGTPKPHPLAPAATAAISFDSVHAAVVDLARRSVLTGHHRRHAEEVDPLLDSLCCRFTRQALQQLSENGIRLSTRIIAERLETTPEIAPFLSHLLSLAQDDQTVVATADGWEMLPEQEHHASAQDIWNSLVADYPDYFQIVHSVGRIGMHLAALFDGSLTLTQICPQESTIATLTRQVLGASSKQRIGNALRSIIAQGRKSLPDGARLGVMEISEGTPLFAADACVSMDFNCCDYVFASTTTTALEDAARLKERFPRIDTRLIAVGQAAPTAIPVCHIAVLTLDFGSLEDAMAAMEYARACLAPGGSLVVVGQHPSRWIDFVFGAQRKHWTLAKPEKWQSNQRSAAFWQQQLRSRDISHTEIFELSPDTLSGPYLMLSKRLDDAMSSKPPPKVMPCSWILLADAEGYSARLSDALTKILQARGDLVVQACPGETSRLEALLTETTSCYGQLDGMVYLAGLSPDPFPTAGQAVLDHQVDRCTSVARIVQACEATATATRCWLVTAGGAGTVLPRRGASHASMTTTFPVDSALWGFGRSLINEASNCTAYMIDMESPLPINVAATALARELELSDNEQEVILTHSGARYVPRLRIEPRPQPSTRDEIDSATIRLGFQIPGQLRNLRWEAVPRKAPAQDEVEIEVCATGLNFRDVMYALGLLSDEAIENGFAGPTLGLEFSGTVQRVGSKSCGFAPGDQVVGFGPSSFGNRVITQASAISQIPPGISFEAAATIPSTFFTVYYALHYLARLQPGEKVLIHGAAGGVGIAAIQLAKWIGAEIYVTAGSDEKRDFLRLLGIDHIYDSRSLSFADEILAATDGEGVDVVLNSLAGEAINRNFRVLRPFGRFLELGKRDFYENTKIGLRPFRNNISYFGIDADQLMQSRPDLTARLFSDLMALFTEGVLHPLPYHVFDAEDIVDAFRYMQQARQIGKIVVTYRNGISHVHSTKSLAVTHLALPSDGAYLVTGGLRGFGLKTAEWLASKGARHLILLGKSGPGSEEARSAIARLEKHGIKVLAKACDVTDKSALAAVLHEANTSLPRLRGVVHAATVIDDGLIRSMDANQISSVLAPKVLGAHNLHELTLNCDLDLFILFSSATTLLGNPGQANYVAANAYLEALAKHRLDHGLPATCVAWGAIDDVGFLARNEKIKASLQSRMGGAPLNSLVALDALESMLLANRSGLGVMELDWKALSRFLPSAATPKFSELAQQADDSDEDEDHTDDIHKLLSELSDADLLIAFIDILKSEIGEILRVATDKIDPARSIYDMGLDSLMGVELVVALESRFGIRLPVMALSQSPTLAKLAERIIQQLKGGDTPQLAATAEKHLLAQAKQVASQHGAETSLESIESLTADIHASSVASTRRMIR